MTENATIFIPDISGYTDFMSTTELEHSSHIINELLDLLVQSNATACTLAEVEGDALLFYRKGEPIPLADITEQCLEMFQRFHTLLKVIERDSICQCGACQTASNLTLKFIVHYGIIKEIKVANFTKASGVDMIIAHRLLKNGIASDEYILATRSYWDRLSDRTASSSLVWQSSSEEYRVVGKLDFQYALLDKIKAGVPALPPRQDLAIAVGDESVEYDVAAPMTRVYELLTDLGNRKQWAPGLKGTKGDKPIDRLGARHWCFFDDMTVEITPVKSEIHDHEIHYVEMDHVSNMELKFYIDYCLTKKGEKLTRVVAKIGTDSGETLPPEVAALIQQSMQASSASFKSFCEANADFD
jgi:hypothetical protein